jgi:signal peptidase I
VGCLTEIVETVVLTIVIFWIVQSFVAQPYRVEQESMRDTLEPDQYVLVDKLTHNFAGYSRGDIVVFFPVIRNGTCDNAPEEERDPSDPPFIKRVIGLPGDTVELVDGAVVVNGFELDEPYVRAATRPLGGAQSWLVEPGRLFVLGDNRDNSVDSRSDTVGEICNADIVGKAFLRYWPITTLGLLQTPAYPGVPSASPVPSPAAP